MPRQVTTAASNRYCQARLKAARYNPDFYSRASAVNALPGVSEDSLKKYELDITTTPNIVVALMADAYNAPELIPWYCANECPLGSDCREVEEMPAERSLVRFKNVTDSLNDTIAALSKIMDNGRINDDEVEEVQSIRNKLIEVKCRAEEVIVALDRATRMEGRSF